MVYRVFRDTLIHSAILCLLHPERDTARATLESFKSNSGAAIDLTQNEMVPGACFVKMSFFAIEIANRIG
jgi:hypothetical protein